MARLHYSKDRGRTHRPRKHGTEGFGYDPIHPRRLRPVVCRTRNGHQNHISHPRPRRCQTCGICEITVIDELSILIPVFNCTCPVLWRRCTINVPPYRCCDGEIIVADDSSTDSSMTEQNKEDVCTLPHCNYIIRKRMQDVQPYATIWLNRHNMSGCCL